MLKTGFANPNNTPKGRMEIKNLFTFLNYLIIQIPKLNYQHIFISKFNDSCSWRSWIQVEFVPVCETTSLLPGGSFCIIWLNRYKLINSIIHQVKWSAAQSGVRNQDLVLIGECHSLAYRLIWSDIKQYLDLWFLENSKKKILNLYQSHLKHHNVFSLKTKAEELWSRK